jgi:hypothetical protein
VVGYDLIEMKTHCLFESRLDRFYDSSKPEKTSLFRITFREHFLSKGKFQK